MSGKKRPPSAEMLRVLRHMARSGAIIEYRNLATWFKGQYAHHPSRPTVDALVARGLLWENNGRGWCEWHLTEEGKAVAA